MAKLTKRQLNQLLDIKDYLERGIKFIISGDTIVSRKFSNEYVPINKFIGSDLCQFQNALNSITDLVDASITERTN